MFKCTDCNMEYEIKPDYCECGNNCFIEEKDNSCIKEEKEPVINNEPERIRKIEYDFKKDLPSILFFIVCLILSFLSIVFLGNNPVSENVEKDVEKTIEKDIKSIDEIWKTPPAKKEEIKEITDEKQQIKPKNTVSENVVKTVNKKVNSSNIKPKIKKTSTTAVSNKKTVKKQQIKPQNQKNKSSNNSLNQAQTTNPSSVNTSKFPKREASPLNINTKTSTKADLKNYKVQLRSKIAQNINFKYVIGDGNCSIKFKLDNNGKLTNGSFLKQSENTSLNDAVYGAFMNTKYFNPPPDIYNGEYMIFSVKIYGGQFEISLN